MLWKTPTKFKTQQGQKGFQSTNMSRKAIREVSSALKWFKFGMSCCQTPIKTKSSLYPPETKTS